MTDREKLVEVLRKKPFSHSEISAGRLADHLIANGVVISNSETTTHKWIPVTERLPEDIRHVLVYHKLSGCGYCDRAWYDSDAQKWRSALKMNMKVTHWMPLPEPPAQKEE